MRTKNILILLFVVTVFFLPVLFLKKTVDYNQQKKNNYQIIPLFSLLNIEGEMVTNMDLKKKNPVLFYFFDPGCEFCRSTFSHVKKFMPELMDKQILFFSVQPADSIISYLNEIDFRPPTNMQILIDENALLVSILEIKRVPSSRIYNRDGLLIKSYDGPVKIETLIHYLAE